MSKDEAYEKMLKAKADYEKGPGPGYRELIKKSWRFQLSLKRWFNEWDELNPTQRSIMVCLELYARNRRFCYPPERELAKRLHVHLETIFLNIKKLEKMGYIKIDKEVSWRGKHNVYTILK